MKDIIIYKAANNQTQVNIVFDNNTLWLNQKQIADVFGTAVPAINKHIKNITAINEQQCKSLEEILKYMKANKK